MAVHYIWLTPVRHYKAFQKSDIAVAYALPDGMPG